MPFLAPAYDENVCPHWAERWEVRTRPLGCQVSTITTLTSLVTVASTLFLVLLGVEAYRAGRSLVRYTKNPGWWRVWRRDRSDGSWISAWRNRARLTGERTAVISDSSTRYRSDDRDPLLTS